MLGALVQMAGWMVPEIYRSAGLINLTLKCQWQSTAAYRRAHDVASTGGVKLTLAMMGIV